MLEVNSNHPLVPTFSIKSMCICLSKDSVALHLSNLLAIKHAGAEAEKGEITLQLQFAQLQRTVFFLLRSRVPHILRFYDFSSM